MPSLVPSATVSRPTILLMGCALWLVLAYWSFRLVLPAAGTPPWIFLDNLNLIIHEAGHWLWMPFGQFMSILGGSLTQCLMPAIFGGYFLWKRDWFGTSFATFWLGDNLVNVSYYVADARAMVLPLLGGDSSGHDWHNILADLNLLQLDTTIGTVVRSAGYLSLLVALVLLAVTLLSVWLHSPGDADTAPDQPSSGAAQ